MNPKLFSQAKKMNTTSNKVVEKTGTNTLSVDKVFLRNTAEVGIFREKFNEKHNTLLHTLYISNEDFMELIEKKIKKERLINDKGEVKVYKRVQDGIYLHNNKSIIAPRLLNLIVNNHNIKPTINEDEHYKNLITDISTNNTGNHHRNHFVKVPPKAIGQ